MRLGVLLPPRCRRDLSALTMLAALQAHLTDGVDVVAPGDELPEEALAARPGWRARRWSTAATVAADVTALPVGRDSADWLRARLADIDEPVVLYVGDLGVAPWQWAEADGRLRGLLTPEKDWQRLLSTALPHLPVLYLPPCPPAPCGQAHQEFQHAPYVLTCGLTDPAWIAAIARASAPVLQQRGDVHLVVLGGEHRQLWDQWLRACGITGRVRLLGPEAYARAATLIGGAAGVIVAPAPEGRSIALLDGLARALAPWVITMPIGVRDATGRAPLLSERLQQALDASRQPPRQQVAALAAPAVDHRGCEGELRAWLQACLEGGRGSARAPASLVEESLYGLVSRSVASLGLERLPPGTSPALARCITDLTRW